MQKLDRRVNCLEKINKQNDVIALGMIMNNQEQGSMKGTLEDQFKKRIGSKRNN